MADFGSPVAQNVNPVGQGFSTLNDLMNFKRSQQELQIGQQVLQEKTAQTQQTQQQNQELQALSAFTRQATQDPAYHNPDGTLNVMKFQADAQKAAPVYGQAYIGQATSNANAMIDNRKALLGLSNEQRKTIGSYFGAVAAKPDATREDFLDAAEQARGVSDDPGYQRAVDRMLMSAPNTRSMPTAQSSSAIQQHARGIAMETNAADTDQSSPSVSMVQGQEGLVPTNINPQAPGGVGKVGPTQIQGLAPTQKPGYISQVSNIPEDTQRFSQISNENQRGQTMVALSQQVSQLADQVRTGKLSKEWTDRLAVLNQQSPGLTARQMLGKYAAQLKTMAESGASTDAERATVEEGMPNPDSMTPGAVKEASQYVGAMGAMRKARNDVASAYVQKNGTNGIRAVDDQFMQHADPFIYMYRNLPKGQERQQFLLKKFGDGKQITDPQALKQFLDQQNVVKHYGG